MLQSLLQLGGMFFFGATSLLTNGWLVGCSPFDVRVAMHRKFAEDENLAQPPSPNLQLLSFDLWFRALAQSEPASGFRRDTQFFVSFIGTGVVSAASFYDLFSHVRLFTLFHTSV